jgi:hypothetical protein
MKRTKLSSLVGRKIAAIILVPDRLEIEFEDETGKVMLNFRPDRVFDQHGNFFDFDDLPERDGP